MSIGKLAIVYGASIVAFFAIDLVWLSTMTARVYRPRLGALLSDQPNLVAAGVFYLLYVAGIVVLAIVPGAAEGSVLGAVWRGAIFGLLAYATYDLTNLATIKDWPLDLTLIDLAWGTFLTGSVSAAGYAVATWLKL